MRRKRTEREIREFRARHGVMAPYTVWAVLFILVPLVFVAYYAFTDNDFNFTLDNITRFFTATSEIINEDGSSEDYFTGDECPFDLDQEVIEIPDEDFGVFYVDTMEHPERYDGKTVHLKMVMCHVAKYPDIAVPGRFAMTCCADDITFFGMVAKGDNLKAIETREWVDVTAVMGTVGHELYGDSKGPLLNIKSAEICEKPDEEVVTF